MISNISGLLAILIESDALIIINLRVDFRVYLLSPLKQRIYSPGGDTLHAYDIKVHRCKTLPFICD